MRVVIDASVVVKWVLNDSEREPDTPRALQLLEGIRDGSVEPLQPAHWLAEVAAVVTRLRPEIAETTLDLLDAMELPMAADLTIYKRASRLAATLNHHLFDTLYHAVALERDATLVSADVPYLRKAGHLGAILALQAWGDSASRSPGRMTRGKGGDWRSWCPLLTLTPRAAPSRPPPAGHTRRAARRAGPGRPA